MPTSREGMKWYVVHAYSGFENQAKRALLDRIERFGRHDDFGEIVVPAERSEETLKNGRKRTMERKFFPGYILIQMKLTNETWQLLKETPRITGIVGGHMQAREIPEEEVFNLLASIQEGTLRPKARASFEVGEQVKIKEGPFADFSGSIEEVKPEKQRVRVLVSIFGRSTPVELDYSQVSKQS